MLHFHQLAATHVYRFPVEQAEREREAQMSVRAAEARRLAPSVTPSPAPRRPLIPRIAGAFGLF